MSHLKKTQAKAPGKLYIAGEYAVTEPGHPSVIVAVDRFIHVTLSPTSEPFGRIHSPALSDQSLKWTRVDGEITLVEPLKKAAILLATLHIAEQFIQESGVALPYYSLSIESELEDPDGTKYGLGSSGAVTVATLRALLSAVSLEVTDKTIYKLASLAHLSLKSNGSFGDLAVAAFTGWLAYARFDSAWVNEKIKTHKLVDLVEQAWPKLMLEPLSPPDNLHLLVGWTGSPASTEKLVGSLNEYRQTDAYKQFLKQSKSCVEQLISGIKTQRIDRIFNQLAINRKLLLKLSRESQLLIETPRLKELCDSALKHGAAAKTSGAGGGDCGIALIESRQAIPALLDEWESKGITPLPLKFYQKNDN